MKNIFANMFLSKEVRDALEQSRLSVSSAMEAKSSIDSIYVTEQLAQMFGKNQDNLADALKEDYYTELLVGRMLKDKEEQEEAQKQGIAAV